jgi:enamine deaminase RidA (YjgF/YER057c/UK114 family)
MIERIWHFLGNRSLLQVIAGGTPGSDIQAQSTTAISRAFSEIEKAGFKTDHIVRSRIWGRDAATRRIASDVRRLECTGLKRGATASFFDAERLGDGVDMLIDIFALSVKTNDARKVSQEYATPVAAPLFIGLEGMVFLSGNTDTSPKLEDQLVKIRDKIKIALQSSSAQWRQVSLVSAFLSKTMNTLEAQRAIAATFPELSCPVTITSVDGFSSPGKLIEIEVTASIKP